MFCLFCLISSLAGHTYFSIKKFTPRKHVLHLVNFKLFLSIFTHSFLQEIKLFFLSPASVVLEHAIQGLTLFSLAFLKAYPFPPNPLLFLRRIFMTLFVHLFHMNILTQVSLTLKPELLAMILYWITCITLFNTENSMTKKQVQESMQLLIRLGIFS